MKAERLFDALTQVRADYIDEAHTTELKKQSGGWKRWTALAACAAVVIGIGAAVVPRLGGNAGDGGAGLAGSDRFMSYAGPVFPLSLSQGDADLSAARNVDYGFALEGADSLRVSGVTVTDGYTLQNTAQEEKTLTAHYAFAGSFQELAEQLPTITVDEQVLTPTLYAGGHQVEAGERTDLSSWQDYQTLLGDGSYEKSAQYADPDLPQRVTVYTFTDIGSKGEYDAATQGVSFTIDPEKTTVLQYGFNGGEHRADGFRRYSYFVPDESQAGDTKMLIVLGEDIGAYTLQGYQSGACEVGNELESVCATLTRSERVLSDIVEEAVADYFAHYGGGGLLSVPNEMFLGATARLLYQSGLLTQYAQENYQYGALEDVISAVNHQARVFYLAFDVTIPAGETASVTASMHKDPSFDFAGAGTGRQGIERYDMVSALGSNLSFTRLTAQLTGTQYIEITAQNYGFDLSKGITAVELDPQIEHYYLELKAIDR